MPTFNLNQTGRDYYIRCTDYDGSSNYRVNFKGLQFIHDFGLKIGTDIGDTCFYYMRRNGFLFSDKDKIQNQVPSPEETPEPETELELPEPNLRINLFSVGLLSFALTVLVFTVANN